MVPATTSRGYSHMRDDISAAPGLKFAKAMTASFSLKVLTESDKFADSPHPGSRMSCAAALTF
jgi:hypothetical protein